MNAYPSSASPRVLVRPLSLLPERLYWRNRGLRGAVSVAPLGPGRGSVELFHCAIITSLVTDDVSRGKTGLQKSAGRC